MHKRTIYGRSLTVALEDIKEVTFIRAEGHGGVTLSASATAWRSVNELWSRPQLEDRIEAAMAVVEETLSRARAEAIREHRAHRPYDKTEFRS